MITLIKCHQATTEQMLKCAAMFLDSDTYAGQDVKLTNSISCVDEEAPVNGIMVIDQDDEMIGYLVPDAEVAA